MGWWTSSITQRLVTASRNSEMKTVFMPLVNAVQLERLSARGFRHCDLGDERVYTTLDSAVAHSPMTHIAELRVPAHYVDQKVASKKAQNDSTISRIDTEYFLLDQDVTPDCIAQIHLPWKQNATKKQNVVISSDPNLATTVEYWQGPDLNDNRKLGLFCHSEGKEYEAQVNGEVVDSDKHPGGFAPLF